jgi:hypothetical protein
MGKSQFKFALLILLLNALTCRATEIKTDSTLTLLELDKMRETKKLIAQNETDALRTYNELLKEADEALTKGPFSVMNKTGIPPSGSKHDYLSLAPYFWPNPDTPDHLPYIRKDGEVNPETRNNYSDYTEKEKFFEALNILGKAFYYSNDIKYAEKAVQLLNAWFIDTATIMNPHLNYGQGIPGVNDGRTFGIIEFGALSEAITTLELLKLGGALDEYTEQGVKSWLQKYSTWLQFSELGSSEGTRLNNHGTTYDVQLCSILLYLGEKDKVVNRLGNITKQRIASQIEPDGSQPHELERTKAFSYSTMNLSAFTKLAWFGKKLGVDLWNYKTDDGRGIKTAYEFLIPYIETDKEWKYQQIESKTTYRRRFASLLLHAGNEFDEPRYTEIAERFFAKEGVDE